MLLRSLAAALAMLVLGAAPASKVDPAKVLRGKNAFLDHKQQQPGMFRKITPQDLPAPFATESNRNYPQMVPRPAGAWPRAPQGFQVDLFAEGLDQPRILRTAPNGDVFLSESRSGQIRIFRGITAAGKPQQVTVFATGLHRPYGIEFYPRGGNPEWVYVANANSVVRFPYRNGDLAARGPAATLIERLPDAGHWTKDIAFSLDNRRMFVAVGSRSNVGDPRARIDDRTRANVLEYTPEGKLVKVSASGLRNPASILVHPVTGQVWAAVGERDGLGDNLPPDFVTHLEEGGFYGWPWYYIGGNEDPRRQGERRDLRATVRTPDVLLQPHAGVLGMTYYDAPQFPSEYRGDLFVVSHGSWNRAPRAGYEVLRIPLENGRASGEFQDFLTGFVTDEGGVWGRPVGVTAAKDGSLLVTDEGSKSIWRVSYGGKR